jgi:glycine cleavage system aminomethyltransferase T
MEKKMTKKDFYNEIITMATENERQDIVEFCEHEIELLERKKSNGKAKVNEKVEQGVELVYNALVEIGRATATELIAKSNLKELANEDGVVTTQKVSAYLNKLVASGRVEKLVEKKKTYFFVANQD